MREWPESSGQVTKSVTCTSHIRDNIQADQWLNKSSSTDDHFYNMTAISSADQSADGSGFSYTVLASTGLLWKEVLFPGSGQSSPYPMLEIPVLPPPFKWLNPNKPTKLKRDPSVKHPLVVFSAHEVQSLPPASLFSPSQHELCPRATPTLHPLPTSNPFSMPPWRRMRRRQNTSFSLTPSPPSFSPAIRPPPFYLSSKT